MAERPYTTKSRAKRIVLDYFKRPHPFRRARLRLSIALPVLAALVVAAYAIGRDHRIYNSGPVSTAHTMFGAQCEHCHVAAAPATAGVAARSAFFVPVSDKACSACHDGPAHHDTQAFTPTCAGCHFEHKGRDRLVDFGDRQCTQCHSGLVTKDGRASKFTPKITSFPSGHPEFLVTLTRMPPAGAAPAKAAAAKTAEERVQLTDDPARLKDTVQVCLNHKEHLKPNQANQGKPGMVDRGKGPQLSCSFCHEPDERRAFMKPVDYGRHCADCHPLAFDRVNFPDVNAPHEKPDKVRAFLRERYARMPARPKAAAKAASEEPAEGRRSVLRGKPIKEDAAPSEGGFTSAPEAEDALFFEDKVTRNKNTCLYCHVLTVAGEASARAGCEEPRPEASVVDQLKDALKKDKLQVAAMNMQTRWLPHNLFVHRSHRAFACASCHTRVAANTKSAEVLVPRIADCRTCHRNGGGARTACVECHVYHDKKADRLIEGPLTIEKLGLRGGAPAGGESR
jgi:hypothetical protein